MEITMAVLYDKVLGGLYMLCTCYGTYYGYAYYRAQHVQREVPILTD